MQSIRRSWGGELLKAPNASGKAAFWQSFVCIDICGHDCQWWYLCLRTILKSLPFSRVCVYVCVVREREDRERDERVCR